MIGDLYYNLPDTYYKRTEEGRCEILIRPNLNKDGGVEGYELGQPFLRAFIIVLDYEDNTIGFANK